jgi:hypothetical protein
MGTRYRALVAAQPRAWTALFPVLEEITDLVPAHTTIDAFRVLDDDPAAIDLIVATIAFDDSRMIEFLQAVKRDPKLRHIPFICSRALAGVLSDTVVDDMRKVCKQCGAIDLLDVTQLSLAEARSAFRSAVLNCVPPGNAP